MGPDVRVGICVERGFELVVAVLGVLKSGERTCRSIRAIRRSGCSAWCRTAPRWVLRMQEALAGRLAGLDLAELADAEA